MYRHICGYTTQCALHTDRNRYRTQCTLTGIGIGIGGSAQAKELGCPQTKVDCTPGSVHCAGIGIGRSVEIGLSSPSLED